MATTEERALKSVPELIKINGNYVECWRNGYIRGATEQKQIDIDKACEWLAEHAKAFGYAEATDVWEATYKYDSNLLVEQFKKAMEE